MKLLKRSAFILIAAAVFTSCFVKPEAATLKQLSALPKETTAPSPSPTVFETQSEPSENRLIVKENNLLLFQPKSKDRDIYILGTIHSSHLIKSANYSFANVQSVIDTIEPDILLIEIRQATLDEFDTLDGPMDMIFAWSYAQEKGINVKGIDWWQITDDSRPLTTDAERDDHIFENILSELDGNKKVLILCGNAHRVEQGIRFAENGYIQCQLQDIDRYFDNVPEDNFKYPSIMSAEILKKIKYLQTEGVDEIMRNTTDGGEAQKIFLENNRKLRGDLISIRSNVIVRNKLYY